MCHSTCRRLLQAHEDAALVVPREANSRISPARLLINEKTCLFSPPSPPFFNFCLPPASYDRRPDALETLRDTAIASSEAEAPVVSPRLNAVDHLASSRGGSQPLPASSAAGAGVPSLSLAAPSVAVAGAGGSTGSGVNRSRQRTGSIGSGGTGGTEAIGKVAAAAAGGAATRDKREAKTAEKGAGGEGWFSEAGLADRVKDLVVLPARVSRKRRRPLTGAEAGEEEKGGVKERVGVEIEGCGGDISATGVWSCGVGGGDTTLLGVVDCVEEALDQVKPASCSHKLASAAGASVCRI